MSRFIPKGEVEPTPDPVPKPAPGAGEKCLTCGYLLHPVPGLDGTIGWCRRYPPTSVGGHVGNWGWPVVKTTDWCGEYRSTADLNPVRDTATPKRK